MGDAAGIGVEIILKSFQHIAESEKFVLIGNREIFQKYENQLNLRLPSALEFINIDYDITNITSYHSPVECH